MTGLAPLLPVLPTAGDGARLVLRRSWPDGDDLSLELVGPDGEIRAARWRRGDPTVDLVAAGDDVALPALGAVVAGRARLVGHRLGKRAIVRTRSGYVKIIRPARLSGVVARHEAVSCALAADAAGPSVPTISAVDPERGTVTFAVLPGEQLRTLLGDCSVEDARRAGHRVAIALDAFAAGRAAGLPTHSAADENQVIAEWQARARRFEVLSEPAARLAVGLAALAREHIGHLGGRATDRLVHRDLHLGQLLVSPTGVGLLDLDTAVLGDAALDVGNLLAHLDLEVAAGGLTKRVAFAFEDALFRSAYGSDRAERFAVATYRLAALVRLVAVHAFRPRADVLVPALLAIGRECQSGSASNRNRSTCSS